MDIKISDAVKQAKTLTPFEVIFLMDYLKFYFELFF